MEETIFIQIASYRDPELPKTIDDIIANANQPERLVFGICRQFHPDDAFGKIDQWYSDPRFRIIDFNISKKSSPGTCWARHNIQKFYSGEKYTLQLDSHMRFVKDWDVKVIKMLKQLKKQGFKKPLITSYVPSFDPDNDPDSRLNEVWRMDFDRFAPEGYIATAPSYIDGWEKLDSPVPARFYSAHFAFADGKFCKEVPHDPEFYFHGEEPSIAVRSFTHGYDLFHPHRIICWHEYTRNKKAKQWDDDKQWGVRNTVAHYRYRALFGMDGVQQLDLKEFGLGKKRTLEDYKVYSGIDIPNRRIQKYTKDRHNPPNPILEGEELENSFLEFFRHCINLHAPDFPEADYTSWAVAFEKDGEELARIDADREEIYRILEEAKTNNGWANLWREYYGKPADSVIIWPHSESKGWCERRVLAVSEP